jgi:hypothetical protein
MTSLISHVTSHVEPCDRGWVRVIHGERLSGGDRCAIHLASRADTSAAHSARQYDSRCSHCWANAPHSSAAHAEHVETTRAMRADFDAARAAAGKPAWRW